MYMQTLERHSFPLMLNSLLFGGLFYIMFSNNNIIISSVVFMFELLCLVVFVFIFGAFCITVMFGCYYIMFVRRLQHYVR